MRERPENGGLARDGVTGGVGEGIAGFMPRFSYTASMTRPLQASRLNMQAFAKEGQAHNETTLLQNLHRLAQEARALEPNMAVKWRARAELRPAAKAAGTTASEDDVWLHLQATAEVPLTCQRCMGAVLTPVEVDQWYRFVATEEIAMAEDDQSEEDLLVTEPQFDLLAVLEDELLMALPLVPMHEDCPTPVVLSTGETGLFQADEAGEVPSAGEKPNPFAVLAQLKTKK